MNIILFVAFMAFLIKFSPEKWWLSWFLIMGLAAQCGIKISMFGVAISMGVSQVLKELCRAK